MIHPPCDTCGSKPPFRYECSSCKKAVCEDCRTPKWSGNEKRWTCESTCKSCKSGSSQNEAA